MAGTPAELPLLRMGAYNCRAPGARLRRFGVYCEPPMPTPSSTNGDLSNRPCRELPNVPGLPVSHIMYEVWRTREELHKTFDLHAAGERENYIRWYLANAADHLKLDARYIEPIRSQFKPTSSTAGSMAVHGWQERAGGAVLRALSWGKAHAGGLARLYAHIPFAWRLALRRRVHAAAGTPMPPLPLPATEQGTSQVDRALLAPVSPGLNLLGYARGEFGVAETLRSYARALERSGYPFLIFDFDVGTASRQQDQSMVRHFSDTLRYAVNAFFINADQLPIARNVLGKQAFSGHHNVGFWLWELEKFPRDWRGAFGLVDEVWAPTAWVREAIGAATDKPVLRMPMAVEFDPTVGMDRAHFGLPRDEFVFLFSYDFNSFMSRKNPEATIAAFRQAFGDGVKDVRLLVKSTNGGRFPDRLEVLERSVADDPRIEVRNGFLSREEMFALENAIDCFVSLHRAEGFGLGLAECMYLGKPVIATRYSGNLDFMDQDNSLLVDYRMVPLRNGDYPYWRGQQWADADVTHAARLMRQVFDDRDLARRVGGKAAASIRRTNSRAVCAKAITARLQEIDRLKSAP